MTTKSTDTISYLNRPRILDTRDKLDCLRQLKLLVVGNPENRRIAFLRQAAEKTGWQLTCIAYADLLLGKVDFSALSASADIIRVDSPGENYEVERLLLARGASAAEAGNLSYLPAEKCFELPDELGRIHFPYQYFLGFSDLLDQLQRSAPDARWMNSPASIRTMFDKPATSNLLRRSGIATPQSFGRVLSFEHVLEMMKSEQCNRLFLKLATSSSASGIIAIQSNRNQLLATTTVEVVSEGHEIKLYNSLRLNHLRDHESIARLVDHLVPHFLMAERWIPKASYDHRTTFDLRVVTINGEPTHFIPRVSSSPMTNLHLGNRRGEWKAIKDRLDGHLDGLYAVCRLAAQVLPDAFYAGLDVVISPSMRAFQVLEMNACGDLLPNVHDEKGNDTYTAQLLALLPFQSPATAD